MNEVVIGLNFWESHYFGTKGVKENEYGNKFKVLSYVIHIATLISSN